MKIFDRFYQLALLCAFQVLRIFWFVQRPHQHSSLVLIWFEAQVLLVRNSYQPRWSAPGGAARKKEGPLCALTREIKEEIGICARADQLHFVRSYETVFERRKICTCLFEWHLYENPKIRIDNREIIEARWFSLDQAKHLLLPEPLADYFSKKFF